MEPIPAMLAAVLGSDRLRPQPECRQPEPVMMDMPIEQDLEPLTVRAAKAVCITGLSRSRIYELIQSGDIDTIKVGRATLIRYGSLKTLTRADDG